MLKRLIGRGPQTNYAELLKQGAIIVDVRTRGEFADGHIKDSLNIPLDKLGDQLNKLANKEKPIITCCASGIRSSQALRFLKQKGYTLVVNGGSWNRLQKLIA